MRAIPYSALYYCKPSHYFSVANWCSQFCGTEFCEGLATLQGVVLICYVALKMPLFHMLLGKCYFVW